MGDHEAGAAVAKSVHRLLDEHLRARIDVRRRLVEDEHGRIGEECARDRKQLAFAHRDVRCVVIEHRVVAVWQCADEVIRMRFLGGLDDLRIGRAGSAIRDVLADGAVEQPGVLEHHAEVAPEILSCDVAGIDAIERDSTLVDVIEPHQQIHDGGLAGTSRTDDRHRLARLDTDVHVIDEGLVGQVAERHVVEHDLAARFHQSLLGATEFELLFDRVKYLEDAFRRCQTGLHLVGESSDLAQWHCELS